MEFSFILVTQYSQPVISHWSLVNGFSHLCHPERNVSGVEDTPKSESRAQASLGMTYCIKCQEAGTSDQKNAIIRAYAKKLPKFSLDGLGNVRSLS